MQLHHAIEQIRATGAELYVIGNGAPMFIAGLRETTGFQGPVYTDPTLAVYDAAHLVRGLATVLTLGAVRRTIGALRRGFRQGRTQGSALQQGGALVIAPGGRLLWQFASTGPGDHPSVAQLIAALGTAPGLPG